MLVIFIENVVFPTVGETRCRFRVSIKSGYRKTDPFAAKTTDHFQAK